MALFGIRAWWRGLRATGAVPTGETPGDASGSTDHERPAPLDDCTLKAYAMQQPDWAEALIRVENARVDGEIRLLTTRLLLGTASASILLFSIAVAGRFAPRMPFGAMPPLTTAALGAVGAALVTALGAALGRFLRRRSGYPETGSVSGAATSAAEPSPEPGSEP